MRIIYGVCRNELYVQLYTQIRTKICKLNVHQCMCSNHYALTTIITSSTLIHTLQYTLYVTDKKD